MDSDDFIAGLVLLSIIVSFAVFVVSLWNFLNGGLTWLITLGVGLYYYYNIISYLMCESNDNIESKLIKFQIRKRIYEDNKEDYNVYRKFRFALPYSEHKTGLDDIDTVMKWTNYNKDYIEHKIKLKPKEIVMEML